MSMVLITDVLFRDAPDPMTLRKIVARRFGVPMDRVNVRTLGDTRPAPSALAVQFTREPEPIPGDFTAWYHLSVAPELMPAVGRGIDDLARDLETVIGTEAEDERSMVLHMPDGTRHVVTLFEGDDDALRFTSAIHSLIRKHPSPAPAVAS